MMRKTILFMAMVVMLLWSIDAQAFGHRRGKRCHGHGQQAQAPASCSTCTSGTAVQPAPAIAAPVAQSAPVVQAACNGNCPAPR